MTTDNELMDAVLNAPIGLDGLAAEMADLAQREPTHDRHAHPYDRTAPDAIHTGQYWRQPQDAWVVIERANALADRWERVGNGYVSLPEAACDLRLALAPHPHRRTPAGSRRSPMRNVRPQDLSAADRMSKPQPRDEAMPRPMFDRAATGPSGDGFAWPVHGHDLSIGSKQSRNGSRSGFQHG